MKIEELKKQMILNLKNEPITITHPTSGSVTLGLHKASVMASGIIELLKAAAGEPVMRNEEMSFEGGEWVLILEE